MFGHLGRLYLLFFKKIVIVRKMCVIFQVNQVEQEKKTRTNRHTGFRSTPSGALEGRAYHRREQCHRGWWPAGEPRFRRVALDGALKHERRRHFVAVDKNNAVRAVGPDRDPDGQDEHFREQYYDRSNAFVRKKQDTTSASGTQTLTPCTIGTSNPLSSCSIC